MRNLAILTDRENKGLVADEQGLLDVFDKYSVEHELVIWDEVDWTNYKNILVRTPWDYALKSTLFIEKIKQAQVAGVNIIHHPDILFWNMDKNYLVELASKMNVVRTVTVENFNHQKAAKYFEELANELVFKPKVGAGGRDTFRLKSTDSLEELKSLNGSAVLVQPFVTSVTEVGEYSFMFFNGEFSHAVLKKVKAGEFRVQDDHGGSAYAHNPTQEQLKQVQTMLQNIPYDTVYARVDVVEHEGAFALMEMEIIEPELFFRFSKNGMENFVNAVKKNMV